MSPNQRDRGRPLGFDPTPALDAAMRSFWRHGYEQTSTPVLEASLGLSRSSIANTFGSKHDLLVRCLDRYLALTDAELIGPLRDPHTPGLEACREFFARLGKLKGDEPGRYGCLIVNTAADLGHDDTDIEAVYSRYRTMLDDGFAAALGRARRAGARVPPSAHAVLTALAITMNLDARAGRGVTDTVRAARGLVNSWR